MASYGLTVTSRDSNRHTFTCEATDDGLIKYLHTMVQNNCQIKPKQLFINTLYPYILVITWYWTEEIPHYIEAILCSDGWEPYSSATCTVGIDCVEKRYFRKKYD